MTFRSVIMKVARYSVMTSVNVFSGGEGGSTTAAGEAHRHIAS
ncbi:hypothetical protein [Polyangium jinanense]|nr:hypothetical protein [Polyangium jinanense]